MVAAPSNLSWPFLSSGELANPRITNTRFSQISLGFLDLLTDWARVISLPQQFYSFLTTFTLYQGTFAFFIIRLRVASWVFWRKEAATFWAIKRVCLFWNWRDFDLTFLSQFIHYYHEIRDGLFHNSRLNGTMSKKTILVSEHLKGIARCLGLANQKWKMH